MTTTRRSLLSVALIAGAAVAAPMTVLAQAALAAGMDWDNEAAHAAAYDAEQTAELFCEIVNRFRPIYAAALPLPVAADETPVN